MTVEGGPPGLPPRQAAPRRGRGQKFPGARDAILTAARAQFAEQGYARTTIRSVARAAGVDPRLVMHFFTSKDVLFDTVLALPEEVPRRMVAALEGDRAGLAERLTRAYVSLWEDPETAPQVQAVFRSLATSPEASRLMRDFIETRVALAATHDIDEVAMTTAIAQLLGAVVARHILKVGHVANLTVDEFVAALVPSVETALAGGGVPSG